MRAALFILPLILWSAALVSAQDGPISSEPIGEDSLPVGEGSLTVREGSVGGMKSGTVSDATAGSVRGSSTGTMLSGPIGESSAGAMTSGRSMADDPPSGSATSGAVRQPGYLPPLRSQRPVSIEELEALEERLRYVEPLE